LQGEIKRIGPRIKKKWSEEVKNGVLKNIVVVSSIRLITMDFIP